MIRVLIAEDEPPTLRRIRRMIEEAGPPFGVVATAFDGEEALALMEHTPCDVVFTDIRMPVMDGLALMDEIRARYPDCQVVIISGYQDFAYVSHAVRARAMDYMLKPVAQEELQALLARLEQTHTRRRKERITRQLAASMNRVEVARESAGAAQRTDAHFYVALFCAGALPLHEDREMLPGNAAFDQIRLESLFAEAFSAYKGFTWAFMGNTQVERILIFEAGEIDAAHAVAALHARTLRHVDIPVNCAYTQGPVSLKEIGGTIRSLRKRLAAVLQVGKSAAVPMADDGRQAEEAPPVDRAQAREVAQWLKNGADGHDAGWQAMLERFAGEAWTQRRIDRLFERALMYLEAEQGEGDTLRQASEMIIDVIETSTSLEELSQGLAGLSAVFDGRRQQSGVQQSVAAQVRAYLDEQYAGHINNQTLGAAFGYVPSYLSLLFRREMGMSPAEYLTQVRLERAKEMMRERPQRLIRDIAEAVGFKNPHHFSRTFRKYEGVWPTDYVQ